MVVDFPRQGWGTFHWPLRHFPGNAWWRLRGKDGPRECAQQLFPPSQTLCNKPTEQTLGIVLDWESWSLEGPPDKSYCPFYAHAEPGSRYPNCTSLGSISWPLLSSCKYLFFSWTTAMICHRHHFLKLHCPARFSYKTETKSTEPRVCHHHTFI